jgi:hypothetical protein
MPVAAPDLGSAEHLPRALSAVASGVAADLLLSGRHSKERGRDRAPCLPTKDAHQRETVAGMDTAVVIVLVLFVLLPAVLVIGLFVWAAIKDGQEDKALQARLGIRRRTRLGR